MDLHELVFAPQEAKQATQQESTDFEINILDILKGIYNNKINANIYTDYALNFFAD